MTDDSSDVEELARRLLAHEIGDDIEVKGLPPAQVVAAGERLFQRLQGRLAQWFGSDGYEALFARALERTRTSHPILTTVTRYTPGACALDGIDEHALAANPEIVADSVVALVTMLLILLARLVGDDMVWHLMNQSWPQPAREVPRSNPMKRVTE